MIFEIDDPLGRKLSRELSVLMKLLADRHGYVICLVLRNVIL